MGLKRRSPKQENSSIDIPNLTEGEHEGRLVYVADLGLQAREYKGEVKEPAQQICLGIEIVGQTVEIDGEEKPRMLWTRPFNIFHQLTEKGKELEFYKVFDPSAQPEQEADWDSVLDTPCNVIIKHVEGKGDNSGKVFDNITNITPIPTKYQKGVEPSTIEPAIGDADDEDNPATAALYGLAKYVFDKRIGGGPSKKEAPQKAPQEPSEPESPEGEEDFDDEDLPF